MIGNDPDCVGVPERTPPALKLMPVGSAPVLLHVNGASPPLDTVNVNDEYAVPLTPAGGAVVLTTGAAGLLMVSE